MQDVDGRTPRIVGDFNSWATTPQGYDANAGTPTRIEGTPWSYLEATAFTNARLEYVLLFEKETRPDPLNPHVVRTFAGDRSEIRMSDEVLGATLVSIHNISWFHQYMAAMRQSIVEQRFETFRAEVREVYPPSSEPAERVDEDRPATPKRNKRRG